MYRVAKVNFGAITLCKYNGTWWYVQSGKVNFELQHCANTTEHGGMYRTAK